MTVPFFVPVTPAAMLAAVGCVIAGGPWFADGLRALRQRRALAELRAGRDTPLGEGPVTARGTVVLASPLFAPLSGRPCAGYELELGSLSTTLVGRVSDTRAFRLATPDGIAEIDAAGGRWELSVSMERTIGSVSELSENLAIQLSSTPELRWLVQRGGPLVLRERALLAGAPAVVLGVAKPVTVPMLVHTTAELERTGTDDSAWIVNAPASAAPSSATPSWSIGAAEPFGHCIVCDGAPDSGPVAPAAWRLLGTVLGPALSLAGLLMLAEAAGHALDGGL
jgi:hypothetical protein